MAVSMRLIKWVNPIGLGDVSTVLIISWDSDSWVKQEVDTSTRHETCLTTT